ncbi:hypothetical protein Hanom_Chr01g00082241 [Helianthus anomalus]
MRICIDLCECKTGKWSLFDFVDPPRNAALRSADRVLGEQELDMLKIHLEQFLLPAVPTEPPVFFSPPPPPPPPQRGK